MAKKTISMIKVKIVILSVLMILSINAFSQNKDLFISNLMDKMTLQEKIGQMVLFTSDWDVTGPVIRKNYKNDIITGKTGAIFNAHTAKYNYKLQKLAVENTRLGIPLIFGYDIIHGYKTIFPISLAESCSWDLEMIEKSARISAIEGTAAGVNWTFAPMVDIARDPRWGRISEGAGEDTYLGIQIAMARIKGFQGDDLKKANTMAACAKHYVAYGAALAGRDYNTVDISDRTLKEIYLPPFEAASKAGVKTFMTAFNEVNGIPATSNEYLLKDILKGKWGFNGFVVTDYTSINELVNHGTAANEKEAGLQSIKAGVDMDMQGAVYYKYLLELYKENKIKLEDIDSAVYRILSVKYDLDLFENPYKYCDTTREKKDILNPEHRKFAREMAASSMVLLENRNNTLPFKKSIKKIAVFGPLGDSKEDMLGSWHAAGNKNDCVSIYEGIKNKLGNSAEVTFYKLGDVNDSSISLEEVAKIVKITNENDAIVLAIGEKWWMSGEAASRSELSLPGNQFYLANSILSQGKPVAVVLMNGRPLAIPWLSENAPALLEAWFPGIEGGNAIADILFGDVNPSGKLTVTFPRNEGQIPIFYNTKPTGRPYDKNNKYTSKYLDVPNTPLYPFGYGLSYTEFDYSKPIASDSILTKGDSIYISATIKNTGKKDGKEIVQLYIRDEVASVTRPVIELKGFKKLFIKAGESKEIKFKIKPEDLAFYDKNMIKTTENGYFKIFVGKNSSTNNFIRIKYENKNK